MRSRTSRLRLPSLLAIVLGALVIPLAGQQSQVGATKVSPPLESGPAPRIPVPPASEITISVTARVTFRDGPTADRPESRLQGWSYMVPRQKLPEGATGSFNASVPFLKTSWKTVKVGQRAAFYAAIGESREAGGPDPCTIDIQQEPPNGAPADAVWVVEAIVHSTSYLGAGSDRFTLGVRSAGSEPGGARPRLPENVQEVTLRSDQRHVLNSLPSDSSKSRCSNVLLEISAERRDEPTWVGAAIDYDVWLVHKGGARQEWREHRTLDGGQRERVSVRFGKLRWSLDGTPVDAATAESALEMRAIGELASWIRPDGLIDLELGGYMGIGGGGGWYTAGGFRHVTVADGETVAFVLPEPSGKLTIAPTAADMRSGRGVSVQAGKVVLDLKQFFDGTRTSILLTPRRRR